MVRWALLFQHYGYDNAPPTYISDDVNGARTTRRYAFFRNGMGKSEVFSVGSALEG